MKPPLYNDGTCVPWCSVEKLNNGMTGWEHDSIMCWMHEDTTEPMVCVDFPGVVFNVRYEPDGKGNDGDEPYNTMAYWCGSQRRIRERQANRVKNGSVRA